MNASKLSIALALFGSIVGSATSQFDRTPPREARPEARQPEGDRQRVRDRGPHHHEHMRARLIERFDADGDTTLNDAERQEAGQALRRLRQMHDRRHDARHDRRDHIRREALERFDTNEDGKLDDTERATAKAHFEAKKAEFMARFDTNANGKIEGDEREAVREHIKARHEERRLDINRDGTLDELDVQTALSRVAAGERIPDLNSDGVSDAADVNELITRIKQKD